MTINIPDDSLADGRTDFSEVSADILHLIPEIELTRRTDWKGDHCYLKRITITLKEDTSVYGFFLTEGEFVDPKSTNNQNFVKHRIRFYRTISPVLVEFYNGDYTVPIKA